jgi:NAD-dependent deacetylase
VLEISPSDRVFVLTGAGISAESGIPTYRDAGGLWRNYRFEEVASPEAWRRDPQLVWEYYSMRRRTTAGARANPAHVALAQLEETIGDRLFLCTQNVDRLHEDAGSKSVIHMHGELFKSRCESCERPSFADTKVCEPPEEIPRCNCGGKIRPHICWFGEMPFHLDLIFKRLESSTIFLAIGTSGLVQPAASFVSHVRGRIRTIYVGVEDPANKYDFSECYLGKAGDLLPDLFRVA